MTSRGVAFSGPRAAQRQRSPGRDRALVSSERSTDGRVIDVTVAARSTAPADDAGLKPASALTDNGASTATSTRRSAPPNNRTRLACKWGTAMDVPERAEVIPEPISIVRCRELLGDEADALSDDEVRDVARHAEAMARILIALALQDGPHSLTAMPRRRTLPAAGDGAKLPEMVGAVIYVRVSTKEQTENLSLPTQLRACEEYCRRQGYDDPRTLPRRRRERQDHGPQPAPGAAEVLPDAQGQGPFRGRLQPHAFRAGEVRPLRAPRAPEVAGHFAAVRHRADRRHVHRQADGRRAGRVRAVRQRRALGTHTAPA